MSAGGAMGGVDIEGIFAAIDGAIDGWFERITTIQQAMADDPCRAEVELGTQSQQLHRLRGQAATAQARVEALLEDAVATALATRGESAGVVGVQSWPEYAVNTGAVPTAPLVVLGALLPGLGPFLAYQGVRDLLPPGRPSGSTSGTYVSPGVYLAGGELRGPAVRAAYDTWAELARTRAAPASIPNARARLAALPVKRQALADQAAELGQLQVRAINECDAARSFGRSTERTEQLGRLVAWGFLAWAVGKAL